MEKQQQLQQEQCAVTLADAKLTEKEAGVGASVDSPLLDLEEDTRKHKESTIYCYTTAGVISSLLLTLIIVCIVLPKTRIGTDLSGARRVHYIAAGEARS